MIEYIFRFDASHVVSFSVDEKAKDDDKEHPDEPAPFWARLDKYTCDHCALDPTKHRTCPAAMAIKPVVTAFGDRFSYEHVQVTVRIDETTVEVTTSTQNAVRSLIGLEMALSACPTLRKLRPMATYHIPFGSREHTIFRAVGMYLIAQFLRGRRGLDPDWSLEGLSDLYRRIHVINRNMAARLRAASEKDATVNGLIMLDVFAHSIDRNIEANLDTFLHLFEQYLS